MLNVKFLKDTKTVYTGSFSRIADNLISITGIPAISGGFTVSRIGKNDEWNYLDYSTIYRKTNDIVIFSNDGSVYEEPIKKIEGSIVWDDEENVDNLRPESVKVIMGETIVTTQASSDWKYSFIVEDDEIDTTLTVDGIPDTYEILIESDKITASYQSIATLREDKVTELNKIQQTTIDNGTDITLSDGTVEHFTMTDRDQASLEGLAILVSQGQEQIPWHTSDQSEHCKFYSNADMALIVMGATSFVTYHVTYFRDLRIYTRSLTTKEEINSVYYGMTIPEEYQSVVLKHLMTSQNASI